MGMGGTQRAAKFVKYLPEFGWQPEVITVKNVAYYAHDKSLEHDVFDADIIRTGSLDPQRILAKCGVKSVPGRINERVEGMKSAKVSSLKLLTEKLFPFFLVPDTKVLWLPFVLARATSRLRRNKFDAVFTTSPPHSVHLAGLFLRNHFGIPWIADFRDRWIGGEFQRDASVVHARLNTHMQKCVLRHADAVVGVSNGLARDLSACENTTSEKYNTITNGFDRNDFKSALTGQHKKSHFVICHCGAVTSTSDPIPFLKGLRYALDEKPGLKNTVLVEFVGHVLFNKMYEIIEQLGLTKNVRLCGYKSHLNAIAHLKHADVLLLSISERVTSGFIPGKLFEYFGARKPILAIAPPGETVDLLSKSSIAQVIWPPEPSKVGHAILNLVTKKNQTLFNKYDESFIESFERRTLSKKLADVFESAVVNKLDIKN